MGATASGAQDSNSFRLKMQDQQQNFDTNFDDLTFNGLLNEYYYNFGEKNETELLTAFTASSICIDPRTNLKEQYVSIGLTSKYDGDGVKKLGRPSCKIVIVLDISGSMSSSFGFQNQKSKLEIGKSVLKDMLNQINSEDYYSLVVFDDVADTILLLTKFSEIDKDMLELKISNLNTRGGTNFEKGFRAAYDILNNQSQGNEFEKRIFYLTDACPNQGDTKPGSLLYMNQEASTKGIYTTFFGVGIDFNTSLVETICKVKGSCYYTIYNEEDFKKLLADDFDYMVFPFAFDIMIKTDAQIQNVYGSNDTNPDHSGRLAYISSFMPSSIGEKGVKGGIILLKLKEITNSVNLTITFLDRDGQKQKNEIKVKVPETQEANFYENTAIRKAILLTRYVALLKDLYKSPNKNKNTEEQNEQKKMEINDIRVQELSDFRDNYFLKELEILDDSLLKRESDIITKLIEKHTQKAQEYIQQVPEQNESVKLHQ